jgi:RNA recognition motif-containing protein
MDVKLYVGNLSYNTSEDDLRDLFAQAGTVVNVDLIKDRQTGRSKGFAFIEMGAQVEAEKAISLFNGQLVDNRELKVNIARPREERRPYGGYSTGGRDRRDSGKKNRRY